eukprot:7434467-Pyramimonas_sp.AAC.1
MSTNLLVVEFHVRNSQKKLAASRLFDSLKNLIDGGGNYARLLVASAHGVRLARRGLAVREHCSVEARNHVVDDALRGFLVNFPGAFGRVEHIVELEG